MSGSLRFLALAMAGWVTIRAISLGLFPGSEAMASEAPPVPPIAATSFPPIGPAEPQPYGAAYPGYPAYYPAGYAGAPAPYPGYAPYPARPMVIVIPAAQPRYAAAPPRPSDNLAPIAFSLGEQNPYFEPVPQIGQWPRFGPGGGSSRPVEAATPLRPARFDRLQLSAWAMMRAQPGGASLASGGTMGGSQAGARLLYRFSPHLAASLRSSAPVGGASRGGEVAGGIRYQPFARIPMALTAERRQAIGRYGGRSAFALFAEGGLYDRPMPLGTTLNAYLQGGVVGLSSRDLFVDGSAAFTRPLWRNISAGLGMWGGAQPGLYRIDAGPRVSMRVGRSMRLHLDYRQRLIGNAQPGSGAVVTVAGDF